MPDPATRNQCPLDLCDAGREGLLGVCVTHLAMVERSCCGKDRLRSAAIARHAAAEIRGLATASQQVYHCPVCGFWHHGGIVSDDYATEIRAAGHALVTESDPAALAALRSAWARGASTTARPRGGFPPPRNPRGITQNLGAALRAAMDAPGVTDR